MQTAFEAKGMLWGRVLILAVAGPVYGGLTILGWIHGIEHWVALILIGGVGKAAALLAPSAPIRHAFAAGFLTAVAALLTQALFVPLYFENNPGYASIEVPFGLSARAYTLGFAPLGGLAAGLLAMAAAWLVSRTLALLRVRA
ncbi:MAG: hypothetical protein AAGE85_08600 [Pseudomonadota bacterium]